MDNPGKKKLVIMQSRPTRAKTAALTPEGDLDVKKFVDGVSRRVLYVSDDNPDYTKVLANDVSNNIDIRSELELNELQKKITNGTSLNEDEMQRLVDLNRGKAALEKHIKIENGTSLNEDEMQRLVDLNRAIIESQKGKKNKRKRRKNQTTGIPKVQDEKQSRASLPQLDDMILAHDDEPIETGDMVDACDDVNNGALIQSEFDDEESTPTNVPSPTSKPNLSSHNTIVPIANNEKDKNKTQFFRNTVLGTSAVFGAAALSCLGAYGLKNSFDTVDQDKIAPSAEVVPLPNIAPTKSSQDQVKPTSTELAPIVKVEPTVPVAQVTELPQETTLYGRVVSTVGADSAVASLSTSEKNRLEASATNDLVASLHSNTHTWSDSPEAFKDLTGKLKTWGGYEAVLASADAGGVTNISEFVDYVASDANLPNSKIVAKNLADQIDLIVDPTINPDQKKVQEKLASISTESVEEVIKEKLANPPEAPKPFSYPVSSTASIDASEINYVDEFMESDNQSDEDDLPEIALDFDNESILSNQSIYDAPEPVTLLASKKAKEEIPDVSDLLEDEDTEDLGEFLVETEKPTYANAHEPIPAGTLFGTSEETNEQVKPEPKQEVKIETPIESAKKGLIDNAVSKVSGWLGAAKKWFS